MTEGLLISLHRLSEFGLRYIYILTILLCYRFCQALALNNNEIVITDIVEVWPYIRMYMYLFYCKSCESLDLCNNVAIFTHVKM